MGEGGVVEKLFIRILNRSLLVGCILLLAGALLVGVLAGINFIASMNPAVDHNEIVITYIPLPPVLPNTTSAAEEGNSAGRISQEDVKLMRMATPGCQALGKFASIITNQRLDFRGGGLTVCERAQLQMAKSFGDKAMNYLSVFSAYMDQLARDPHVAANYGSVSDDDAKAAVDVAVNDFASKFKAAIGSQNTKNLDAQADAIAHRIRSFTLLGVAGAAFLSFLFIAFLIVFLRIEKHLELMSGQSRAA
jgi:hypothetical protein